MSQDSTKQRDTKPRTLNKFYLPPNDAGLVVNELGLIIPKYMAYHKELKAFFYGRETADQQNINWYRMAPNFWLLVDEKEVIKKVSKRDWKFGPVKREFEFEYAKNRHYLEKEFSPYFTCKANEILKFLISNKMTKTFSWRCQFELKFYEETQQMEFYASIKK